MEKEKIFFYFNLLYYYMQQKLKSQLFLPNKLIENFAISF